MSFRRAVTHLVNFSKVQFIFPILSALILFFPIQKSFADVNPDGSFGYSIPIKVPPGRQGVQPNLALVYNSNAGNGMLGVGWNLAGLSYITRDPAFGIKYDGSDHYTHSDLGQLVYSPGYIFYSRKESFTKIQAMYDGDCGDGPCYWVARDKSGVTYYYGGTSEGDAEGRIEAVDKGKSVRVWALRKVVDLHGNYMEITYDEDTAGGDYYPKKIEYTKGGGSKFHSVEFEIEGKDDPILNFSSGSSLHLDQRLKWIIIKAGGEIVRKYEIIYKYGSSTGKSRITEIKDYADNSASLYFSNRFEWSSDNGEFFHSWLDQDIARFGDQRGRPWFTGDFSGDGIVDVAFYAPNRHLLTGISYGDGTYGWYDEELYGIGDQSNQPWRTGDFNGDGKSDIFIYTPNKHAFTGMSLGNGNYAWYEQDISGFGDQKTQPWLTGDFNGDGLTDVAFYAPNRHLLTGISYGDGTYGWYDEDLYGIGDQSNQPWRIGDFNGDGKSDIFIYTPNKHAFTGMSLGNGHYAWYEQDISGFGDQKTRPWLTGDFNGDGLTDVAFYAPNRHLLTGISYGDGTYSWYDEDLYGIGDQRDQPWRSGDFNGDGKSDIFIYTPNEHAFTGLSLGNGHYAWQDQDISGFGDQKTQPWFADDFNGDGAADVAFYAPNKHLLTGLASGSTKEQIKSIFEAMGSKIDIDYASTKGIENAIIPSQSQYPLIANNSPRNLVTKVTTTDGRGASYSTSYEYHNGKFFNGPVPDRTSLGFEYVIAKNDQTGAYEKTYYHHPNMTTDEQRVLAGQVRGYETHAANGSLLKSGTIDYEVIKPYGTGTEYARLKKKTDQIYEMGSSLYIKDQEIKTYDSYGNPTEIEEKADGTETISTTISYSIDPGNWILNRPSTVTKKIANGTQIQQEIFVYNTGCGANALCEKQVWLDKSHPNGAAKYISTKFTYYSNGNVNTVTDARGYATTFTYEEDYDTYPKTIENPATHKITRTYKPEFGVLWTENDVNGLTKTNDYDEFGRLKKVWIKSAADSADKWIQEIFYENIGNPDTQYIETRTRDTEANSGYRTSKKYFDGLGRTYREVSDGVTDAKTNAPQNLLITEYEFDAAGRLKKKYNPYIASVNEDKSTTPAFDKQFTEYTYDHAGRVGKVTFPEPGVASVYSYSSGSAAGTGGVTVTDQLGKWQRKTYDARGRISTIEESGIATVAYSYDIANKMTTITDADGKPTTIQYDSLGRKISMDEPNTGTWQYGYDENGNLVYQKDPKGQVINFTYDELNRIRVKDLPGTADIVYTYDDTAISYSTGRLTAVTDASGSTAFSYDSYGNVKSWKKVIDGKEFSFAGEYDTVNRLEYLTYPDGSKIRNYYSSAGYLRMVRLMQDGAKDMDGNWGAQVVTYAGPFVKNGSSTELELTRRTGNNTKTTVTVDTRTFRPVSVFTESKTGTVDENYSFTYDLVGNIRDITDLRTEIKDFNITQKFGYDDLYRLDWAQSGLYGSLDYDYSKGGNLIKKDNIDITYATSGKPQAASSMGTNNYAYDTNGNMISRKDGSLDYDSEDHLIRIRKGTSDVVSFVYDYTGQRVLKIRSDGTRIYNVNGLYEFSVEKTGTTDTIGKHTKYIYGINGELVAQVQKKDSTFVTQSLVKQNKITYASFYKWNSVSGFILNIYYKLDYFVYQKENVRPVLLVVFTILCILLIFSYIYNYFLRAESRTSFQKAHPVLAHQALLVLMLFLYQFGFYGCSTNENSDAAPSWGTPVAIGDTVKDVSEPVNGYDGSTTHGFPVEGTYFFHPTHLGSVAMVTDVTGNVITRVYYMPYGEIIRDKSSGPDMFRNKYTGQEEDAESGLFYYGARFYDPEIGRFITADTVVDPNARTQGYNRYMYVGGNPTGNSDPSGNFLVALAITVAVSAVIGGASSYISYGTQTGDWSSKNAFKAMGIGMAAGAVGGLVGFGIGSGVAGIIGGGTVGTIAGSSTGGLAGGAASGATGAYLYGGNNAQIWESAKFGGISGLAGGFVGGAAVASGIPIVSGFALSMALGGSASGATGAGMTGGNVWEGAGYGFAYGFAAGWMTGIANRQFMTDGTVGKGNKIQDGYEGQIIGLQSVKGSIKDWFWSTLVGGYSHVSTVDSEGNLVQYGGKAYSMKGRGYEIIGYDEGLNLTATRLHPKVVGDNNYYYNTNTNNCSTTLSTGFSIPSQWTPYNIYSYYNYPQFGYWYH